MRDRAHGLQRIYQASLVPAALAFITGDASQVGHVAAPSRSGQSSSGLVGISLGLTRPSRATIPVLTIWITRSRKKL